MKVKMKFDLAAIKEWFLAHGEKVFFGAIVLAFAMFTWGAVKREVLDAAKDPETLKAKAAEIRTHVQQSQWDPKREGVEVVDYTTRAKREPVLATNFPFPTPFDGPLADDKAKRDDPNLFGVEELRVASGISIFELKGARAGGGADAATLKAQPWVAITALVPFQKQTQEYARVFQNAKGDMKNSTEPEYTAIIVYRAEDVGRELTDADFKPIPVPVDFQEKWNGKGDEIVNKLYVDDNLTAPLGPLAGKAAWDQSVGHPKIPLAEDKPGQAPAQAAKDEDKDKDQPAADAPAAPAGRVRLGQALPAAPVKPEAGKSGTSEAPEIAYKLLRVFDYSVEAKKKYKYRVALEVRNPNHGQLPHYLRNPDSGKKEVIETAMSAPTDLVATPTGYRVLAAGLAAKSPKTDPAAKIMVTRIDAKEGIEPAGELEVSRGSIANFSAKELRVVDPHNQVKELRDVEIKTNVVVLDVRGGRPLVPKKDALSPIEVLILDPDGNLSVCNELDDAGQVAKRRPPEESSTKKRDVFEDDSTPKARPKKSKNR